MDKAEQADSAVYVYILSKHTHTHIQSTFSGLVKLCGAQAIAASSMQELQPEQSSFTFLLLPVLLYVAAVRSCFLSFSLPWPGLKNKTHRQTHGRTDML